jgi:hypothetical protein
MKWLIGILVVILIAAAIAWYSGVFPHGSMSAGSPQQAAAVNTAMVPATSTSITTNGTAAGNPAISAVTILTSQIDQQIQANAADFASLSSAASLATEVRIAGRIGTINSQMLSANASLQSLTSIAKAAGRSTTAAYSDLQKNISGATTVLVAANKAIAVINPTNGSANTSALSAILTQLRSAESYVQSARADIQVIVKS